MCIQRICISSAMKGYLAIIALFGAFIGVLATPTNLHESVDKIWPIPQKDGSTRWMTRGQAILEAVIRNTEPMVSRKLNKVRFFLYTQSNPTTPFEIDMDDPSSLTLSSFNQNHPTRFFVHGWNGGYLAAQNTKLREALLLNGENRQFNFFAVDWSVYAETITYIAAQGRCSTTGEIVAGFIDWLSTAGGLSFDTLALYGHGLGAHVAGFAGKNVNEGTIHTIIGADTALPLFNYFDPTNRLSDTDATYVESIHTNGGFQGFYNPIGRAAFYPNGGTSQPGCGLDVTGACAQERAVDYLAEALRRNSTNGFNAVGCSTLSEVTFRSCSLDSEGVRLGEPSNADIATGIYYLETNGNSPFGKGV